MSGEGSGDGTWKIILLASGTTAQMPHVGHLAITMFLRNL